MATIAAISCPPVPLAAAPGTTECGAARNDILDHKPWPLHRLQPEQAWPMSTGRGVKVAVIDSGVSSVHPKLHSKVDPGRDLVPPGAKGCDNTHGTLVAAIIAATTSGDPTFYGVAPDARIVPIRVLPDASASNDPGMSARIAEAIRWAVGQKCQVINLSLYTDPSPDLAAAVKFALDNDVVVVAAGGNVSGSPGTTQPAVYPASYEGVIGVGGIDENDQHVSSSVTGNHIAVAAPGVRIEGPAPQGRGYGMDDKGGTSFAAGYVSGVAALIKAYQPDASPTDIQRRITLTADAPPGGRNQEVGYGVVNPYRALATNLEGGTNYTVAVPKALPPQHEPVDPLHGTKIAAAWIVPIALLTALLMMLIRPVLRRGRARGWQPSSVTSLLEPSTARIERRR